MHSCYRDCPSLVLHWRGSCRAEGTDLASWLGHCWPGSRPWRVSDLNLALDSHFHQPIEVRSQTLLPSCSRRPTWGWSWSVGREALASQRWIHCSACEPCSCSWSSAEVAQNFMGCAFPSVDVKLEGLTFPQDHLASTHCLTLEFSGIHQLLPSRF